MLTLNRRSKMAKRKNKFAATPGSRVKGNVQAIGEELDAIKGRHGVLTPELLVKTARARSSPSHGEFNWDDGEAAFQFRLIQARTLIRSVLIVWDKPKTRRRRWVHVQEKQSETGRPGRYEHMEEVVNIVSDYQAALEELQTKLHSAMSAVQELQAVAGQSKQKSKLALIRIVSDALRTADGAIAKLSA
jgi:hypothetical protein